MGKLLPFYNMGEGATHLFVDVMWLLGDFVTHKEQGPTLGKEQPHAPEHAGGHPDVKQLWRKGSRRPGKYQVYHESALYLCCYSRLRQAKYHQQIKAGDPSLLFSIGEATHGEAERPVTVKPGEEEAQEDITNVHKCLKTP